MASQAVGGQDLLPSACPLSRLGAPGILGAGRTDAAFLPGLGILASMEAMPLPLCSCLAGSGEQVGAQGWFPCDLDRNL